MTGALILGLHLATAHIDAPPDAHLQGRTVGVYARAESGLTLGAYRNSYGRPSTYAAWTWSTPGGMLSLTAGAVTGYPRASVSPLLVPSLRLPLAGVPGWAVRLSALPKPHSDGAAGLHLSLETAW